MKKTQNMSALEDFGSPFRQSAPLLERVRKGRQIVMICSSFSVLVVMFIVMSALMISGDYQADAGTAVDVLTMAMLGATAWFAFRDVRPNLQSLLLCTSVPLNLLAMLLLDGNGAWPALLLLSITPIMWGLFAPAITSALYTVFLVAFFNIYLGPLGDAAIAYNGTDQTTLSGLTLSLVAVSTILAAMLPRQLVGAAFTSLKKAISRESLQRERLAQYAQMSSDWHLEVNNKGIVVHFFGSGDAVGAHWQDILCNWEGEAESLQTAIQKRKPFSKVQGIFCVDGNRHKVECSGNPFFADDGSFAGYRVIAHDITERVEAETNLQLLATTDRVTGLENRHAFNMAIEALEAGSREGRLLAAIYIDLDKFKAMNDRHGHACGDYVLAEFGQRLSGLVEATPSLRVFRLGGDEFCCLVENSEGPEQTRQLVEKISELMSQPIRLDDRLIDMTASIGAACADEKTGIANMLEQADAAVYEAKSLGGGHTILPQGQIQERLDRRINIQRDFSAAIANDHIDVQYQPIFDVRSGSLVAVEALARWQHPRFGSVPPSEFIQIAEASRDIIALGRRILSKSCKEARAWMKLTGQNIRLNVNVSPNEMLSHGFVDAVFNVLEETGFPANLLELEITERGLLYDIEASMAAILEIRSRGVTIALDDFGTGHSSLSRLERLPVDRVKIDRSFFSRAEQSERAGQILGILSGMSRILNVEVIAEGIETEAQMRLVEAAGFAKAQGYLLGKPGEIEALSPFAKVCRQDGLMMAEPPAK